MSVIVEDAKGNIILYCKGADSIILDRMDIDKNPDTSSTNEYLSQFADEGLRTLLITCKNIPKKYYEDWAKRYLDAACAPIERQERMEELQEEIETDLMLLGATAIEDKLQDEVGPTIAFLKSAGIKVWVLTGDKIETAINIGFSCNLLNKDLKRLIIDGKDKRSVQDSIQKAVSKMNKRKNKGLKDLKLALVVSGDALIQVMANKTLSEALMQLGDVCEAVLCCRVSPKQKQEVVTLVRKTVIILFSCLIILETQGYNIGYWRWCKRC
jgi:magnesium-transporting ATPase (P-type)